MRRLKKILKWMGLVVLFLFAGITTTVSMRQHLKYEAPYPDIHASTDTVVIARGKHLVFGAAHCINCHSVPNADSLINLGQPVPLTGGVLFDLPLGKIYSKNITPDSSTGIGRFTDGEIARALRYGVHPDGTAVYDFMPFHNMSDEDLGAIISYLRAQPGVHHEVPKNILNAAGKAVQAFMVKPVGPGEPVPKTVTADTTGDYGRYLALSVAECNGCHTQRNLAGAYTGAPFGGGSEVDGFITPNLTPDSSGRIFNWNKEKFISRFRSGKLIPGSPMPWYSFGRMTDEELTAIYHYLKTLKPVKTVVK
ncbi:MAG TPA: cytochrome c [Puia sp.]|nr:cytochrome c [Puia sp.]